MTFSIKIEHNHQISADEAKRQAEQDQSRLDDEISKKITKKKQQEKFEKTELPIGFTHAIPPEARKLMEHYAGVTKLTDNIHKSLASGKKSLVSTDDEKSLKATPSGGIVAKEEKASNGNLSDGSQDTSDSGGASTKFDFNKKTRQQPNFLNGDTGLSTVASANKHPDAGQTETMAKSIHQNQAEIQAADQPQRQPQIQQQSALQSQNQTQAPIQTSSDLNQGASTSVDRPGTQQSQQSTQGQSFSGQINSTSSSGDKNLNVSSKISNVNAAEISSPGSGGKSDTAEPKLNPASAGRKSEDQDQAREAVQSMPEQNVQVRTHQTTEQQDTPSAATTAPQQIAAMNAMLTEQKAPVQEGVKYNLNSWGGNQSVQITGTTEKGYKLQGSDAQVQQILQNHVDDSLPMTIDSDGLSVDLTASGAASRAKAVTRDA